MQDVITAIKKWQAEGQPVALATVTSTWGSAPRRPGAKLALTDSGQIAGSVSGGCVESEVVAQGQEALATGAPRLLHFGVADETAWSVGLACGGELEVFVAPLPAQLLQTAGAWLEKERGGAIATIIAGPDPLLGKHLLWHDGEQVGGSLGTELDGAVAALARAALAAGQSQRVELESARGPLTLFIDVLLPPLTLLAIGGGHVTVALTRLAAVLGYRTVVVDPRRAFASAERFPHVDQLVPAWPQQALPQLAITPTTAVALLSHDPKIDDPALQLALASDAFYVGALGSRRTHEQRLARLREAGVAQAALDRIHAPIGLDLGAQSPEEVALAIMAEIVAAWHGRG
jgi:xanthine dehydrogenase accessory factor